MSGLMLALLFSRYSILLTPCNRREGIPWPYALFYQARSPNKIRRVGNSKDGYIMLWVS